MATKRTAARLHLLNVKQVQAAGEGDHSDGGGLMLRVRGDSCSWVFRYSAPSGRRREMGLGPCHRTNGALAGDSLTTARGEAHKARDLLAQGVDPIDAHEGRREQAQLAAEVLPIAVGMPVTRHPRTDPYVPD